MHKISPTPSPLRESNPRQYQYYSHGIELWDMLANVVYYTDTILSPLIVDAPIPCRLQIEAAAQLDTAGATLTITVDGVPVATSVAPGVGTVPVFAAVDVTPGIHQITLTYAGTVGLPASPQILVRRGRAS